MSDQNFHEIQLSGKQLVFLFMCAVVFAVVVFLFGVSVGQGVRSSSVQAASAPSSASSPTDTVVPAETPPPTQTSPNELSYAQALQGEDPSKVAPPPPVNEAPAPEPPRPATDAPKPPPQKKDAAPAPPVAPPPSAPAKTVPPLKGFFVQVGAFSNEAVAAKQVATLQAKGYPAFVFTEPDNTPGPRFKVRVGPYSASAEANQTLKNLTKDGYKPLIKR